MSFSGVSMVKVSLSFEDLSLSLLVGSGMRSSTRLLSVRSAESGVSFEVGLTRLVPNSRFILMLLLCSCFV